ncbi:MAG: phage holin [Intestinibacter sp.]
MLLQAVQSPIIVVSVLVSVWNLLNDPTTKGLSDSSQALTYTEPKKSE